ncbi:hypothetical protein UPYG_G00111230 [Umbra pygmaea]|uniref:Secreted protein n=1 Tax=Umbra pygmaea TaxID=75934 RepID=A0ABD0X3W6_UMBPY
MQPTGGKRTRTFACVLLLENSCATQQALITHHLERLQTQKSSRPTLVMSRGVELRCGELTNTPPTALS